MLDTVTDGIPVYMHLVYGLWCDPSLIFCVMSGIPVRKYMCVGVVLRYGGGILCLANCVSLLILASG